MRTKFEEIVNGLIQNRVRYWKPHEVEEYLSQQEIEIDKDLMTLLLERLVEDEIWKWLEYITNKLHQVASTEKQFLALLGKIASKVKGDMAQGPFIRALIDIGSKDPDLGFALYEEMAKDDLIEYSGLTLGGAGKTDFEKAFELIKKGVESGQPDLKAACIKALRVIFEKEKNLKKDSEIFQIFEAAIDENEDVIVRNEAANAYIDFNRFAPDECTRQLVRLANQDNSNIRYNLATKLEMQNLDRNEDTIKILRICSQDDDQNVLWRVSIALAFKGKEYPEESLDIIKAWIKQGKYFKVRDIEYCLQEIGKVYQGRCIKVVEDWIEKEKDKRLQFFIPIVLKEMCSSNYGQLIESVELWSQRDSIFQETAIKTIRAVLTEIYPPKAEQGNLVDTCFSILSTQAEKEKINIKTVTVGEPDKFFQCFRLLEELELKRPILDYGRVYANLENYPIIKRLLGDRWFQRKKNENNKTHPLLIVLSHEIPKEEEMKKEIEELRKETDGWRQYLKSLHVSDMLWPEAFLKDLEGMLEIIVSKTNKLKELRNDLANEDQFWQTISEIEVISSFMRKYAVEIAPKIDGKKLDAKIEIDGEELLVEVIKPEFFKPLRYLSGKTMGIENRARDKIYDEFKKHLKDVHIHGNVPVVVVIDIGRSEISYEFVEDYLMGTLQLVMLFDKEKGEAVRTYPGRAQDNMHTLDQETAILSAVLCYKRRFSGDGKFHCEGKIIPNKFARNSLSQDLIQKIQGTMFG